MAYHVSVEQFEGPLDLLVQLVEANRLEVTAISAAAVTEQFVAAAGQLQDHQLAELGRYLELAARLVVIKSLALLPAAPLEPMAEVAELDLELERYQRNRRRARLLAARLNAPERSFARAAEARPVVVAMPSAERLLKAYRQLAHPVLAWQDKRPPKITLEQMIMRVERLTGMQAQPLHSMIEDQDGPGEIALLLVAALELVRQQRLRLEQTGHFAPIMVAAHA